MTERPDPPPDDLQDDAITKELFAMYGRDFAFALTDTTEEAAHKRAAMMNALLAIQRFSAAPEMVHKGDDLRHTFRTEMLASLIGRSCRHYGIRINPYRIQRLARYHDVLEIATGDIPTQVKQNFSQEEKEELDSLEAAAAPVLAKLYAPEGYEDVFVADLTEVKKKETPEAQIVDIADKWDGLGQVLHDIRCGNTSPEVFQILQRYRDIFRKLRNYPVFQEIEKHNPNLILKHIPSDEEAKAMSKIRLEDLKQGKDIFWKNVLDPSTPPLYQTWLKASPANLYQLDIFPTWNQELRAYQLSGDELMQYYHPDVII